MNIDEIIEAAACRGMDSYSDFLRGIARSAVEIRLKSGRSGVLGSRFGGSPALPPDFKWPTHEFGRYQFLGQINFADIESPPAELPSSGLLSLFFATDPDGEIFSSDPNYVVGSYFADLTDLVSRTSPDGSEPPECELDFETSVGLPRSPELNLDYPLPEADKLRLFDELLADMDAPSDYLLGYPSFNTLAYDPTPGGEWMSLMTLSSHDELDWCWNDGDKLMVFIEKQKLAVLDFSNLSCDAG